MKKFLFALCCVFGLSVGLQAQIAITISNPTEGQVVKTSWLRNILIRVDHTERLASFIVSIGTKTVSATTSDGTNFICNIDLADLPQGPLTISVNAKDIFNRQSSASRSFIYDLGSALRVDSPTFKYVASPILPIKFSWQLDDNVCIVDISLTGSSNAPGLIYSQQRPGRDSLKLFQDMSAYNGTTGNVVIKITDSKNQVYQRTISYYVLKSEVLVPYFKSNTEIVDFRYGKVLCRGGDGDQINILNPEIIDIAFKQKTVIPCKIRMTNTNLHLTAFGAVFSGLDGAHYLNYNSNDQQLFDFNRGKVDTIGYNNSDITVAGNYATWLKFQSYETSAYYRDLSSRSTVKLATRSTFSTVGILGDAVFSSFDSTGGYKMVRYYDKNYDTLQNVTTQGYSIDGRFKLYSTYLNSQYSLLFDNGNKVIELSKTTSQTYDAVLQNKLVVYPKRDSTGINDWWLCDSSGSQSLVPFLRGARVEEINPRKEIIFVKGTRRFLCLHNRQIREISNLGKVYYYDSTWYLSLGTTLYTIDTSKSISYYTKATGEITHRSSWGTNADGSGAGPVDFGTGKTFYLSNRQDYVMGGNWSIKGVVNIPKGSVLKIAGNSLTYTSLQDSGYLEGSATSNLTWINGADYRTYNLPFKDNKGVLNNLTLNRPYASTIAGRLDIYGVLNVSHGTLDIRDTLTLKSTDSNTARVAFLNQVTAKITGNITVERYIPARRAWRLLCAPVETQSTIQQSWQQSFGYPHFGTQISGGNAANGFDPGNFKSIKKYNYFNDTWDTLSNTNVERVNAVAYMVYTNGDRTISTTNLSVPPTYTTLRASGKLITGQHSFQVLRDRFAAIPNPYPSPINFANIIRAAVQNKFWVWDPKLGGAYGVGGWVNVSWNGSSYDVTPASVSPESQYIQSGQAFMVQSSGGTGGAIVIRESDKSSTPSTDVFRPDNNLKGLRITLQTIEGTHSSSVIDEAFSSFGNEYSDKVDEMDVTKLANAAENLAITRGNNMLMVERRSEIKGEDVIQLKLWNTDQKSYQFEINPSNLLSTVQTATLEDSYLHVSVPIDLNSTTQHQFTITADPASQNPYRFRVILNAKASSSAISASESRDEITAYPNPVVGKTLNVIFGNKPAGNYNVELIDSKGIKVMTRLVYNEGNGFTKAIRLDNKLERGVYRLQVSNSNSKNTITILSN